MEWKIWYDDKSTFDSTMGEPHEAPTHGFQFAVGYDVDGKYYTMSGWDHYRFDRETHSWWGMDYHGVFDRLRFNKEIYAYKEGRTVSNKTWGEIAQAAHRDPTFKKN